MLINSLSTSQKDLFILLNVQFPQQCMTAMKYTSVQKSCIYEKDQIRSELNKCNLTFFAKPCPCPGISVSLHENYKKGCSFLRRDKISSSHTHSKEIKVERSEMVEGNKYSLLLDGLYVEHYF